jgi:LacI family transcriptional regulator
MMKDGGDTGRARPGRSVPSRVKPNVSDVARRADVSVATVSRAFNTPDVVKAEVRDRVLKAARDLGYAPNAAAKALRMQRTHTMGAIVPTLNYDIFARMLNAFQARLSEAGHMVFLLTTGFDNRVIHDPARLLVERGAEALLIVGRIDDPALEALLLERRIPTVTTYSYLRGSRIPSIGFDNYAASRELIDHLIGLGHKRLAMVAARTQGNDRQEARVKAFRDATTAAGMGRHAPVIEVTHAIADGAAAMRALTVRHPEVTAVVCNSDVLAMGALAEAKRLGLRVPDDISITGHDDQEMAALTDPPLTTIAVPAHEMGIRAAEALLEATGGGGPVASLKLPTTLVLRGSTGAPRISAKRTKS